MSSLSLARPFYQTTEKTDETDTTKETDTTTDVTEAKDKSPIPYDRFKEAGRDARA